MANGNFTATEADILFPVNERDLSSFFSSLNSGVHLLLKGLSDVVFYFEAWV